MRRRLLVAAAALALAGCQDPNAPVPDRVIHIAIEGCKDATPAPVGSIAAAAATPAATELAIAPSTPVSDTVAPVAPLTVPTLPADPVKLAPFAHERRQSVFNALIDRKIDLRDAPEVATALHDGDAAAAAGDPARAISRYADAESAAESMKVNRDLLSRRAARIKSELAGASARLGASALPLGREEQDAEMLADGLQFPQANDKLADVDRQLDALIAASAATALTSTPAAPRTTPRPAAAASPRR